MDGWLVGSLSTKKTLMPPPPQEEKWTPELEEALFSAVCLTRPIGVHKHFRILNIQKYLMHHQGRLLTIPELWERLSKYYDLVSLDAAVRVLFSISPLLEYRRDGLKS